MSLDDADPLRRVQVAIDRLAGREDVPENVYLDACNALMSLKGVLDAKQHEKRVTNAKVFALAEKLDDGRALLAALGARELAGQACGPMELLGSGWTNPRQEPFTQVHADQILDEVLDDMMDRINAEQNDGLD